MGTRLLLLGCSSPLVVADERAPLPPPFVSAEGGERDAATDDPGLVVNDPPEDASDDGDASDDDGSK